MRQYIVGGAVRDVLLGSTPKDIDFVWIGSTVDDMVEMGLRPIEATTFPVFLDKDGNEHALARTERKVGHGYHGFECEYDSSVTLKDDQFRRDLTINQMAVAVEDWEAFTKTADTSLVIDEFGGVGDLKNNIIRHVSTFFCDDAVRVLRAARFAARYLFTVHDSTIQLMTEMVESGELNHLVAERVWTETEKALGEKQPKAFFDVLDGVGAVEVLFPELRDTLDRQTLISVGLGENLKERLAVLVHNMAPAAAQRLIMHKLRMPYKVADFVLKFNRLIFFLEEHGADTVQRVESLFKILDVYRDKEFLKDAQRAASCLVDKPELYQRTSDLWFTYDVAKAWGYDDLTDEQKSNLRGPQVGEAISHLRRKVIENKLRQ